MRFGMGAREMASGRKPSMDRISTRRARGAGVGVIVSVGVNVSVGIGVSVAVADGVEVDGCKPMPFGNWQAKSRRMIKLKRMVLRVFMIYTYNKKTAANGNTPLVSTS